MTRRTGCSREGQLFDLVWTGQWPARADATLRTHVARCAICSDLVVVATALGQLEDAPADARVPDASAVWYAAQARARQELAGRAARPVLIAEAAAVSAALGAAVFGWRLGGASLTEWWTRASAIEVPGWPDLSAVTASPSFPWLAGAALAWALVVPAAWSVARFADRLPPFPATRGTRPK